MSTTASRSSTSTPSMSSNGEELSLATRGSKNYHFRDQRHPDPLYLCECPSSAHVALDEVERLSTWTGPICPEVNRTLDFATAEQRDPGFPSVSPESIGTWQVCL